ncbi:MAG: hydrogenase maturation protease [Chloroflexi bacterium]|nr:hydrogenase maturation protease [Chloroflexota bacterium]
MTLAAPTIRVLVCGSADRGDDGAALCAVAHILPRLDPALRQRVEVRRCEQLDAADLIDVADGEACLVLDTVVGVEPGTVVRIPLDELARLEAAGPRSSHALPISQVLGIAEAVRGQLPRGLFVGIGGKWFGFGETRSRALRDGMAAFEAAAEQAIQELSQPITAESGSTP